jgi:hypothetical protein
MKSGNVKLIFPTSWFQRLSPERELRQSLRGCGIFVDKEDPTVDGALTSEETTLEAIFASEVETDGGDSVSNQTGRSRPKELTLFDAWNRACQVVHVLYRAWEAIQLGSVGTNTATNLTSATDQTTQHTPNSHSNLLHNDLQRQHQQRPLTAQTIETLLRKNRSQPLKDSLKWTKNLPTLEELEQAVLFWYERVLDDSWAVTLKERTVYLFAYARNQELPTLKTSGNPKLLAPGHWGRKMAEYCFRRGAGSDLWRTTILLGLKKGMPTVSDETVKQSLKDLEEDLTTEHTTPPEILECIKRTSKEVFKNIKVNWGHVSLTHQVSDKSSYEYKRSTGGPRGHLLSWVDRPEIVGIYMVPFHPQHCPTPFWVYSNKPDFLDQFREERLRAIIQRGGLWKACPIREPLKVRPITAGPYNTNAFFSDVQKSLWSKLQKYEQFGLTRGEEPGSRFQELFLQSIIADPIDRLGDDDYGWKSGDFSAATNKLHADCTLAAIDHMNEDLRNLLRENLTQGEIVKGRDKKTGDLDKYSMRNGQLMGSLFSFPLLCVINLAILRWAVESWTERYWRLRDLPALVNGDDILFLCTRRFEAYWRKATTSAGLIPSLGKDYWSKQFAMVNSTYIKCSNEDVRVLGKHVPYLNMGIYMGLKKGENKEQKKEREAASMREKLASLPGYFRDLFKYYDPIYNSTYEHLMEGVRLDRIDYRLVKNHFSDIRLGLFLPVKGRCDGEERYWLDNYPSFREQRDWLHKERNFKQLQQQKKENRRDLPDPILGSYFWDPSPEPATLERKVVTQRAYRGWGYDFACAIGLACGRDTPRREGFQEFIKKTLKHKF